MACSPFLFFVQKTKDFVQKIKDFVQKIKKCLDVWQQYS